MKSTFLVIFLIVGLAISAAPLPPAGKTSPSNQALNIDNTTYIDANSILMFVTNHGNFGRDLSDVFHQDAGTFFPFTIVEDIESGSNVITCNYASGLWIGGMVNGAERVTIAEYSDEYVPGIMENGTFTPDEYNYRVYKLYSGVQNWDYDNWPYEHGAPWKWDPDAGEQVPDMIGHQMLWSVYNDANLAQHTNNAGETEPLGIEIRQTTWAYDDPGPLGTTIFLRFRVFNKGYNTIENCYFSLWADPDLGGAGDDLVGCDPESQLGYVYNATNDDDAYGSNPPCMGYDFAPGANGLKSR